MPSRTLIERVADALDGVADFDNVTFNEASGSGIKVNKLSPKFPWRDIEGLLYPDPAGVGSPVVGTFLTGVRGYAYANADKMDFGFHMPHDYAMGTDLFLHVHWAHNADTSVIGDVVFNFGITYAKGHNQANFAAAITPSITYALTNITTTPRYRHRIDEIQLSAASPTATQLDSDNLEPDGLIQGTMTANLSGATMATTSPANTVYVFTIDLHYQSTGIGTLNKAPDFFTA